jgi:hypothetical protein
MQTELTDRTDSGPELPEDVASAWANVLLDLWEKRSGAAIDVEPPKRDGKLTAPAGSVMEGNKHVA